MNTKLHIKFTDQKLIAGLICLVLSCEAVAEPNGANRAKTWQHRVLFEPSEQQLQREQSGFVNIYDGITDKTIERVMDEQFERIPSMMFVRTVVTDEQGAPVMDKSTGKPVREEDGC